MKPNEYRIESVDLSKDNLSLGNKTFDDKKTAQKFIKDVLKIGEIEKRGYEYFLTSNYSIEFRPAF